MSKYGTLKYISTFNQGEIPYEQSEANDLLHREQFLFSRPCGPT